MMFTKISGVLLATLLVVLGLKEVAHVVYHPHALDEPAYPIEVPEEVAGGAPVEEGPTDYGVLIPAADLSAGEAAARKCLACHTFEAGGPIVTGPNLHDVLGREAGAVPGFAYSTAMANYDQVWSYENLDAFLDNPRAYMQGTNMVFAGLPNDAERMAMIAYLRSLSPNAPPLPDPLPEAPADDAADGDAAPAEEAAATGPDYGTLLANADLAAGEATARICLACHTFTEGGPIITGPNLFDAYGRPAGEAPGFAFSQAMASLDYAWDPEHLDGYLADPRTYVPGTNMVFAGIPNEQDRMNVIAWMHSLDPNAPALPAPHGDAATDADATDDAAPADDAADDSDAGVP